MLGLVYGWLGRAKQGGDNSCLRSYMSSKLPLRHGAAASLIRDDSGVLLAARISGISQLDMVEEADEAA